MNELTDAVHHVKTKVPDSIEISLPIHDESGYQHAGWLFEVISDLPDWADTIHFTGDSYLSQGLVVFVSLVTLGFVIFKLLKKLRRKKRGRHKKHFGIGAHSHSALKNHISPVVQNYISFDPHQSNLGWSSAGANSKANNRKRKKNTAVTHSHHHGGWGKFSGKDIRGLVNYLKQQEYYNNNDYYYDYDDSDYY